MLGIVLYSFAPNFFSLKRGGSGGSGGRCGKHRRTTMRIDVAHSDIVATVLTGLSIGIGSHSGQAMAMHADGALDRGRQRAG